MAAEEFAVDALLTALRRAGPEGIRKEDVQKESGLSVGDLRPALAQGVEDGTLVEREVGRKPETKHVRIFAASELEDLEPGESPLPIPSDAQASAREFTPPEPGADGSAAEEGAGAEFRVSWEMTADIRAANPAGAVAASDRLMVAASQAVQRQTSAAVSHRGPVVFEIQARRVWPTT